MAILPGPKGTKLITVKAGQTFRGAHHFQEQSYHASTALADHAVKTGVAYMGSGHGGGNPYHDARGEFTTATGDSAAAREGKVRNGVQPGNHFKTSPVLGPVRNGVIAKQIKGNNGRVAGGKKTLLVSTPGYHGDMSGGKGARVFSLNNIRIVPRYDAGHAAIAKAALISSRKGK